MPDWTAIPPSPGDIVAGFFPETKPKQSWSTNPRPLLVLRTYKAKNSGKSAALVAYGTTQIAKVRQPALIIGNMTSLDMLNLAKPTAFVLSPTRNLAVLPWSDQHFACWKGRQTPVIGRITAEMKEYVHNALVPLGPLPTP